MTEDGVFHRSQTRQKIEQDQMPRLMAAQESTRSSQLRKEAAARRLASSLQAKAKGSAADRANSDGGGGDGETGGRLDERQQRVALVVIVRSILCVLTVGSLQCPFTETSSGRELFHAAAFGNDVSFDFLYVCSEPVLANVHFPQVR
jgi:hypothetical protein